MTSNRTSRWAAALVATGAISLALAGTAAAAPGQLAFDNCFASLAGQGCESVPAAALDGATGVAASADGKSVYVASSRFQGSIASFSTVGPANRLLFDGCRINDFFGPDCFHTRGMDLDPPNGIATSPNGKRVYIPQSAPGGLGSQVTAFLRDTVDGTIDFGSCAESGEQPPGNPSDPGPQCFDVPAPLDLDTLDGAAGVAVSPDSRNVYVVSERSDSILVFGAGLGFVGCFSSRSDQACTTIPDNRLDGAFGVAVSPDGRSVYVASHDANSISHFRRSLDGKITPAGCIANADSNLPACGVVQGSLGGANGVAVSPDDASVYVTARDANAISTFSRGSLGDIAFDGCLAFTPTPAGLCQPGAPLIGAKGVTVSPDGRSVYVASSSDFSDSVSHLVRAPGGQLSFESCLDSAGAHGCGDVPNEPLNGASGVAVSPDGKTVYVASPESDSLSQFSRSTSDAGQLGFGGCQSGEAGPPCETLTNQGLGSATDVAVSPDGRSVYTISAGSSDAITRFARRSSTGPLNSLGCLSAGATAGCTDLEPGSPIGDPSDVVVSPDGRDVYVTSSGSDSIAHFVRDTTSGQISYEGCLANTAADGCTGLEGAPLDGARSVAVSSDGEDVYVASDRSAAVAHFTRNATSGQLAYDSCRANVTDGRCIRASLSLPLTGASGVAVSADGRNVYVAAAGADAIVRFIRSTVSGRLTFGDCLADDDTQDCTDVPNTPLDGAAEVALSPDGTSVYVASPAASSITRFARSGLLGNLAFGDCHANNAADGCTDLPDSPLDGLRGLAVSPDGQSVYATAATMRSITHFVRDAADGGLDLGTCQSGEELAECRPLSAFPLTGAAGVTVSPDGASVYVASTGAGSITRFSRQRGGAAS